MKIRRAHKVRLYPDRAQDEFLRGIGGATRCLWNLALEQRRVWGQRFGLNRYSQSKEVTAFRAEYEWMKACPVHVLQQVLIDQERAFANFFSGRAGFPRFRRKTQGDSFRFPVGKDIDYERVSRRTGRVKLPKLGWVHFRGWKRIAGAIRNVTVSLEAGCWYAAIQWEAEVSDPQPMTLPAAGVDRGIVATVAVSDQGRIKGPDAYRKAMMKLRRAQRKLARRRKGSQNRRKAVLRLARLHQRVRRVRADFLHKLSRELAESHGTLVFEALKIRNMVRSAAGTAAEPGRKVRQKAGLNRSILDQGWGMLRRFCDYKIAARGGSCVDVDPVNSSRECRICGHVSSDNRVSQARFLCVACGHAENADENASVVLLKRAVDRGLLPVEALRRHARETGTSIGTLLLA